MDNDSTLTKSENVLSGKDDDWENKRNGDSLPNYRVDLNDSYFTYNTFKIKIALSKPMHAMSYVWRIFRRKSLSLFAQKL